MEIRHITMLCVLAGSLAAPMTAYAQSNTGKNAQQPAPAAQGAGQAEMLPDAPDFELKDLDGKTVHLRDFRGKAVLLNFWATWCVPCKQEMPWLSEFQQQYGPQGLVILGIAMDNSPDLIKTFLKKFKLSYRILLGNHALADHFWVKGYPASIYIDRSGRITDQVPGLATRSFMENEIKLALQNGER